MRYFLVTIVYPEPLIRYYFKPLLWSLLLLGLTFDSQSQEFSLDLQKISVEEGLSSRTIYTAFQDQAGFIWISTSYGLDRYDGSRFKHFSGQESGIKPGPDKLLQDFNGNIWLHYSRAESEGMVYDVEIFLSADGKGLPLKDYLSYPLPFQSTDITSVLNSSNGGVLVSTVDGTIYELSSDSVLLKYRQANGEKIHNISLVSDTGVWIVTMDQTIKLDKDWKPEKAFKNTHNYINYFQDTPETEHVRAPLLSAEEDTTGNIHYRSFDQDRTGSELIMSSGYYKNGVKQQVQFPDVQSAFITTVPGTANQLWMFDSASNDKSINLVSADKKVLASVPYNWTYARPLFFDQQNNLWIYNENSIVILSWKKSPFSQYLADHKSYYGVDFGARGIIEKNNGRLIINGLGKSQEINTRDGSRKPISFSVEHESQSIRLGFALANEGEKTWFSFEGSKIHLHDPSIGGNSIIYRYKGWNEKSGSAKTSFPKQHWDIHIDRQGTLWTGNTHGLSYLDREKEYLVPLANEGAMSALQGAMVINIYENDTGLWLATNRGIYLFDPVNRAILEHYHADASLEKRLPHNSFAHIYEDKNEGFWLASKGGGLIRWHPPTGQYRQFTVENGLSNNVIYAVYEDSYENLWLPSDKGINQFNKASFEVNHFSVADGLSHNEFNTISHYRGRDSTLYFGGLKGVNVFNPNEIVRAQTREFTPLVITGLQKQSRKDGILREYTSDFLRNYKIDLEPGELGFQLQFSHLDFRPQINKQYAYILEGIDADWSYINTNSIRINPLIYGQHNMLLKARQSNGLWTTPISIPLIVNSPLYMKTWFISLCLFLFLGGVYLAFRIRLRRLKRNEERLEKEVLERTRETREQAEQLRQQAVELKKLDEAKSQFFANISHELRTPLTLIMGPVDQMIQDQELTAKHALQLKNMYRNGHNLTTLVEEILELSKLQAGKLEVHEFPVRIKHLLNRIFSAYESMAERRGIVYISRIELDNQLVVNIDTNKTEKIINNLLSNALKFTPKDGLIKFEAALSNNRLYLVVEDSGKGISEKDLPYIFDRFYQTSEEDLGKIKGGTGIGLALVKELTEVMNGSVSVESRLSKGTRFELHLPVKEVIADKLAEPEIAEDPLAHLPKTPVRSEFRTDEPSLLLVEDNPDMQDYIASLLTENYNVHTADNGLQALEVLKKMKPDLIISDVMMPEMDGFTLLERLKSEDVYRNIPVIMLTSLTEQEDKLSALTIGVDDYLTKPFVTDELLARIKNLLHNYKLRQIPEPLEYHETEVPDHPEDLMQSVDAKITSAVDLAWMKQVEHVALSRLTDHDFSMQVLADSFDIGVRQLQRKVKDITGLRPNQYIQELRLQLSRSYLEKKVYTTVNEVSQAIGFQSTQYFSKLFKERFGKNPSDYLAEHNPPKN
ncbi:MAG: response regulator [Roseivirga sp.]|nr:response regulator [Roseivirga sp.]